MSRHLQMSIESIIMNVGVPYAEGVVPDDT